MKIKQETFFDYLKRERLFYILALFLIKQLTKNPFDINDIFKAIFTV